MAAVIGRRGLAGLGGAALGALAQFVLVVVVTRAFPAAEAGAFFTATALILMAAGIAKLDAGNGLIYFIARAATYDYRGISGYLRAAIVPCVVVAAGAAVVLYPRLGPPAALLPAIVVADVLLAATRGFGMMRPTVLLDGVLVPVGQVVLVGGAALAGVSGWGLTLAWAAPYLPVVVLGAAGLRGRAPRTPYLPGTGRDLWRYTAPRSVAGAIQAVFQRVDIVIVALLAGPAQAAVYTAATRFKVVGQLANQGLAQPLQAGLVRALACGERERARELYQSATAWLVLLTWPVWLAYAVLAPWVLRLFGPSYGSAAPVALVLAGTMMVATACGMVDVVLTAAGHTGTSLANLVTAIGCTVLLDVALIPAHGALGAVAGWSGGVIVKNLLPLWQLHRRYGLHPFGRHTLTALRRTAVA
ncbi:Membrane protein involved in the export of O-antigen and teichoic acid-like [[Actinomadura] parvosata subsp. kistnae]|uniref:Polysaccharide biosynthesis protein n=1 Tax=[Actinomadura] parvosata subsp. kistnae TaxID=1909395 RepID=A0A1V0AF25_9ACTN|nr:lipopolysaccharide biosynthesis protein [Nonomuraea sp. ATCC 55076]AQZ68692.1 polysaccharide biosynthesis protein [Nonomuraea sp. ATCC 55076]SPL92821.1 Membrane protein involved in the export of O-antigen and teichoic acid-like [Actinomadura parvosata subsp. kistnae]